MHLCTIKLFTIAAQSKGHKKPIEYWLENLGHPVEMT